ncbi:PSP1 domain-containing protein [Plectosphaerella plurivora]|uniref:PSP1 domain-containing protein n=1 Tax=Plectosphaerella plurivora TaxID=936078 RepID=A0A9P8VE15_9PEZI|nr:PSP1 domain-containing protein [Plectosphaerella plurivora]
MAPNNQALLLDKLNRRSTPDSEALASSDDEPDHLRQQDLPQPVSQPPRPVRRASWLNDTSSPLAKPRKGSFASSSMSPTASHPTTPPVDSVASAGWGAHQPAVIGRQPAPATFPWPTGIWNNDRKDPPSRLSEVLPSPTSTMPPGGPGSSFFGPDHGLGQTSPGPRDHGTNSQIPFAIPLHPTPKTYRSQSYSVGQLDPDTAPAPTMNSGAMLNRGNRGHPHSGLQHRPSRPSMLSEMSNDTGLLGKVKEVDDDDEESAPDSMQSSMHQTAEAKQIEYLTRENALLRHQQQQQQQQQQPQQQSNRNPRPRASTSINYGLGNGYAMRETVPEESDFAIDELDEANDPESITKRAVNRRMSEIGAGYSPRSPYENRKLENVKKAFWHSSLGFGGPDGQQSRRHSFADLPQRQASISSLSESMAQYDNSASTAEIQAMSDYNLGYSENSAYPNANHDLASYFTPGGGLAAPPQGLSFNNPFPSPYGMQPSYGNRAPSPHRPVYAMSQPRHNQLLHIVLFKCARADVFYIQEGTGLTVKPGDLVIVEADRGTDLGTVMQDNVDWQKAKDLKEHYAEEHYKWLMMYSQNAAAAQDGSGAGLLAAANGLQGSAVGGMGPPSQHHMQEPNAGELKPKLIKRLAQAHEIHALRDKEGNEAKAKRVCMQKVKEHGLNMEILDAEFQMDWKKLTFYYFADSYINFNSLVTDLFKIYKTRIWMSAINPASFASPTLGIQAPSGIGPGAVGIHRGTNTTERRQNPAPQPQHDQQQPAGFGSAPLASRGPQPQFGQPAGVDRNPMPGPAYPQGGYPYSSPMGAIGHQGRPGNMMYGSGVMPSIDSSYSYPQGNDFSAQRGRFQTPPQASGPHDGSLPALNQQVDWANAFQGLSLGSR